MDRETFEKRKAFAGEKRPSQKRRCIDHDYHGRRMYMLTMVVEGRRKLFGEVHGHSDRPQGSADAPHMELSELGKAVMQCWMDIPKFYPEASVIALQMMPDHLHGILFVHKHMAEHLGTAIKGFKTGCNKAYRKLENVGSVVATVSQHTKAGAGFLFELGYNDRILLREGQLQRWIDYLADNPRRLLAKREHPDLFRVHFGMPVAGQTYAAIGNRFLLQRPCKVQVQCSRSLTPEQISDEVQRHLTLAHQGAVLVSPAISPGEKAVMRAAMEAHLPLIFLSPSSFTAYTKPGGSFIEACSRGDLLILAPWPDRPSTKDLTRQECLTLNNMTETICMQ